MNTSQEVKEIMAYLEEVGSSNTVKIYRKHGAHGDIFGVKVGDLKPLQKKYKNNNEVAKALFATNNSDAMYLACLMSDPKKLEKETIQKWVEDAWWYMLSEYAVAWVLAESTNALKHINGLMKNEEEHILSCAWSALSSYIAITSDDDLDLTYLNQKLLEVETTIHDQKNRVRHTMNGFVIALGSYVPEITERALSSANKIGKVEVFMGETSCKVPFAPDYIQKIIDKGRVGKKRKTAKC